MYNSKTYRVDFSALKSKVGVIDAALAIGYRLNKKAGVGVYVEMVLTVDGEKRDTIIVKNSQNKASQTFFRRDGSKGDAITLIKENLSAFHVHHTGSVYKTIGSVLCKMANMPEPNYKDQLEACANAPRKAVFDPQRYITEPLNNSNTHSFKVSILQERGFNTDTIAAFAPFIKFVTDNKTPQFKGANIGFPYIDPASLEFNEIKGYEIRGANKFKSKAAGTDSSNCCWIAAPGFADCPEAIAYAGNIKVYLTESAFDAMAFYQHNKFKIDTENAVLCSFGGTFSDNQVRNLSKGLPKAIFVDCFDNDLVGRSYAVRLASIISGTVLHTEIKNNNLIVSAEDKPQFIIADGGFSMDALKKHFNLSANIESFPAPFKYKDWNDCLLGKAFRVSANVSKHDRNERLYQSRKSAFTL